MEDDFSVAKKNRRKQPLYPLLLVYNLVYMYTAVFSFKVALKRFVFFGVNNEAAAVLPELIICLKFMFFLRFCFGLWNLQLECFM